MVDIKRWYNFINEKPNKKGKYLVLVGLPNKMAGYTELGIVESVWNGNRWDVDPNYIICKWKYKKPGEIDKYPDFNKNVRRNYV